MNETFSLITALSYLPATPTSPAHYPLLQRHLARLQLAHSGFALELPESWCSKRPFPSTDRIMAVLDECVLAGGIEKEQRIRLSINDLGNPVATQTPVNLMPAYPVRVVLDTQSTDYITPFHRFKTTSRAAYDDARVRHGAILKPSSSPSDPPFDTLLYNSSEELTESTIANLAICLDPASSPIYITPKTECGLLEGVMRAELLEKGEIVEGVLKLEDVRNAIREGTLKAICFNGARGVYEVYIRQ